MEEAGNYFKAKAEHIFEKSFSKRNSESLNPETLARDVVSLSFGQQRKFQEICSQFAAQRTKFALNLISEKLKSEGLEQEMEKAFETHVLCTNFPFVNISSLQITLDEEMEEQALDKLLIPIQNRKLPTLTKEKGE